MSLKHQSQCYRYFKGEKYVNYADLIYGDKENERVIAEAKAQYGSVRKVKHKSGYYQLFVK